METIEMVELDEENLDEKGCYCFRSKPNSTGYINKNEWVIGRFNEGLNYIEVMENSKRDL